MVTAASLTDSDRLSPTAVRIAEQATDYIREHGLPAFTLREFAESIGTSHRMVIHYLGSRDQLLAEVFHRLRLEDVGRFHDAATSARQLTLDMWRYYTAAENELRVTIFFDLLGSAFQQPSEFEHFLESLESWGTLLAELAEREGYDPAAAETKACAVLAGFRGLLIHFHATGDRAACHRAIEALLDAFFPVTKDR